ncbi:hypothetical protein B0J12DRAFT_104651 [Macrophomina phaseolina]|uniref:Uncharacterized protein n=1 Tax=Macrophomina phaseolina TaxID=35725 RepID=A0ABQ8GAV4_9PEZI|nr:hypothetical protein B0J12DRAFT_104651 [Macrophomina phaseolina]
MGRDSHNTALVRSAERGIWSFACETIFCGNNLIHRVTDGLIDRWAVRARTTEMRHFPKPPSSISLITLIRRIERPVPLTRISILRIHAVMQSMGLSPMITAHQFRQCTFLNGGAPSRCPIVDALTSERMDRSRQRRVMAFERPALFPADAADESSGVEHDVDRSQCPNILALSVEASEYTPPLAFLSRVRGFERHISPSMAPLFGRLTT